MKRTTIYLLVSLLLTIVVTMANAQTLRTPAPSPLQTLHQDFALSHLEIAYSRPSMKGRTVFGDVVPFGEIWRTGANRATRITFGEDVKVGGSAVKAGDYALYTIPGKTEWEVILNKGVNNGGTDGYKTEEDVVRFKVKPVALPSAIETFTIQIANQTASSAEIQIIWEKTMVSFTLTADIDSKIMSGIDNVMNKDNKPYFAAASYYFDNGKDLKTALDWVNKAIESNQEAYWMFHLKAKIQAKMGDKKGATETSQKSLELAKKASDNNYIRLNEKLLATLK
jgi:hypothetical protein